MSDRRESATPVEPYFDRTPQPSSDGLPDPLVYDASPQALRQRTINFAAKRLADMRYVSRLDRATAERHFRWRPFGPGRGNGFSYPIADFLGPDPRPCAIRILPRETPDVRIVIFQDEAARRPSDGRGRPPTMMRCCVS